MLLSKYKMQNQEWVDIKLLSHNQEKNLNLFQGGIQDNYSTKNK